MRRLQRRTDRPATLVSTREPEFSYNTHEDQRRVQILIILFYELLIVLLGFLAIVFIEPSPTILVGRW